MKNSKNKLWSLLLILGLVIIGAVVWFVYNSIQFGNCIGGCDETPLVTETVSTEDWKTYTNEELGFTFKYPSNYTVDDICSHEACGRTGTSNLLTVSTTNKDGYDLSVFSIWHGPTLQALYYDDIWMEYSDDADTLKKFTTFKQFHDYFKSQKIGTDFSTTTFADTLAYTFKNLDGKVIYALQNNNDYYNISVNTWKSEPEDVGKNAEEIAASFRFTQ
jgi:hypothetical protein